MKTIAEKKALKAAYIVDQCVNHLNEYGLYDLEKAHRKAKSWQYWNSKR